MKKIIRLTESDLYRIVKRTISESEEPEPVFTEKNDTIRASFLFGEGETSFDSSTTQVVKDFIKNYIKSSIPTIQKFHNSEKFTLPQLVTFYVGTSSTGDFTVNKKVAEKRMNYLTNIYLEAMKELGVREDVAYKLLTQSYKKYTPSKIDRDFYDPAKVEPDSAERICFIEINPIETMGKTSSQVDDIEHMLRIARGMNVDPDEDGIAKAICNLQTYSDIKDLDTKLKDFGGLQAFINQTIEDGLTSMGSDTKERAKIQRCLNYASKRSGKGDVAKIVNGNLAIILENKTVRRITESDLVRIVKRVISEDYKNTPYYDPIQEPFYNYVRTKWGHDEDPMFATDEKMDKDGRTTLVKGPAFGRNLPGTDEDTITWDYKKGVVTGTKSYGTDPKPISIKSNFEQMKKWFDSTY